MVLDLSRGSHDCCCYLTGTLCQVGRWKDFMKSLYSFFFSKNYSVSIIFFIFILFPTESLWLGERSQPNWHSQKFGQKIPREGGLQFREVSKIIHLDHCHCYCDGHLYRVGLALSSGGGGGFGGRTSAGDKTFTFSPLFVSCIHIYVCTIFFSCRRSFLFIKALFGIRAPYRKYAPNKCWASAGLKIV